VVTLWLIIGMLVLNAATWLFPKLGSVEGGYGISFSLSDRLISSAWVDVTGLAWWQTLGAIVLSSIPLVVLSMGLLNLRALFRNYAAGNYFSSGSAIYMEKLGWAVNLWVVLTFLCEPLLGLWVTLREPVGQRFMTLSFDSSGIVAIFLATCIILIARILRRATEINTENQQFV